MPEGSGISNGRRRGTVYCVFISNTNQVSQSKSQQQHHNIDPNQRPLTNQRTNSLQYITSPPYPIPHTTQHNTHHNPPLVRKTSLNPSTPIR